MNNLDKIDHVVVLMLENRSFDSMLGWLYTDQRNVSPSGNPYDGLTGNESCPDGNGNSVAVSRIMPSTPNAYLMPGADPGEGYYATVDQLANGNQGFVTDFAYTLGWQSQDSGYYIVPGTEPDNIMGCYDPSSLPVLSALAKSYAVCDQWFASVPTETLPNRAFAGCATSQGHMDDKTHTFTAPSIFRLLGSAGVTWAIYGYDAKPLTASTFTDVANATSGTVGQFADFQSAAKTGKLASYVFLEPSWGSNGNSQHPNYDVALGEQLIKNVYEILRHSPCWNDTLLIVTYDEHGGCFDHVVPPSNATPPDTDTGEYGFDFTQFGVRVPAVLVSPLIKAGTVFRTDGVTDHTSVLKTLEQRYGLPALTARDSAAPSLAGVLALTEPRTDDVLAEVVPPASGEVLPDVASHLQQVEAELLSRAYPAGKSELPAENTGTAYASYIREAA
jgi:phospholipase C